MKIFHISDTHGINVEDLLPSTPQPGSILVHSGDFSTNGDFLSNGIPFFTQISNVKSLFDHIIIVPGNHDMFMEEDLYTEEFLRLQFRLGNNVHILKYDTCRINGINFFGMPYVPRIGHWAFMEDRNSDSMRRRWELIPDDTQVLISHGPPLGILDYVHGERVGCELHLERLDTLPNLKANLFGHIHEDRGVALRRGVLFSNSSCMDECYDYGSPRPAQVIHI